jgi:hypothetical protein
MYAFTQYINILRTAHQWHKYDSVNECLHGSRWKHKQYGKGYTGVWLEVCGGMPDTAANGNTTPWEGSGAAPHTTVRQTYLRSCPTVDSRPKRSKFDLSEEPIKPQRHAMNTLRAYLHQLLPQLHPNTIPKNNNSNIILRIATPLCEPQITRKFAGWKNVKCHCYM